jgi:hypothetical protein
LLIIMTPHVVRDKDELDAFRYAESERMSWCLADVLELYGNVQMTSRPGNWCPCGGCGDCRVCRGNSPAPIIFPDTNPAGMMGPVEMNPAIEPVLIEPVPEPEPSSQGTPVLPPTPSDNSSIRTPSTNIMQAGNGNTGQASRPAFSGPAGQPAQFPAMATTYEGVDSQPWPAPNGNAGGWQKGVVQATARRLPPEPN